MPRDLCHLQHGAERSRVAPPRLPDDPERDAAAHRFDRLSTPTPAANGVEAHERDERRPASDGEIERGDDPRLVIFVGGGITEHRVECTGRDEPRIDIFVDDARVLEGLDAHFGAEGARRLDAQRGDFGGEHHPQAEHLLLVALDGAVIQGLVVFLRRARERDAVVEVAVEISGLEVHVTVDIHSTRKTLQELDLAVAVGGVEIRDYFIPNALRVLLWVVEMKLQRIHACVGSNYYMFVA